VLGPLQQGPLQVRLGVEFRPAVRPDHVPTPISQLGRHLPPESNGKRGFCGGTPAERRCAGLTAACHLPAPVFRLSLFALPSGVIPSHCAHASGPCSRRRSPRRPHTRRTVHPRHRTPLAAMQSLKQLSGTRQHRCTGRQGRMACRAAVSAPAEATVGAASSSGQQIAFKKYQGLGNDFILVSWGAVTAPAQRRPATPPLTAGSPPLAAAGGQQARLRAHHHPRAGSQAVRPQLWHRRRRGARPPPPHAIRCTRPSHAAGAPAASPPPPAVAHTHAAPPTPRRSSLRCRPWATPT